MPVLRCALTAVPDTCQIIGGRSPIPNGGLIAGGKVVCGTQVRPCAATPAGAARETFPGHRMAYEPGHG